MCPMEIYVRLLDESVDVWRPVRAEHIHGNVYRILDDGYDPALERWEFGPGEVVWCEIVAVDGGKILAAVRKADG